MGTMYVALALYYIDYLWNFFLNSEIYGQNEFIFRNA